MIDQTKHWIPQMSLSFHKLHPYFAAEASPVELRQLYSDEILAEIRAGMDEHAVLVFRNQNFSNNEQLEFAQRLDGSVNAKGAVTSMLAGKNRLGYDGLSDVSNVNEKGEIWSADDRTRQIRLTNRLWHSDATFHDPAGRYSMLSAKAVPPVSAPTEFADMRAAYDALDTGMKAKLDGLRVHHSSATNKDLLGFSLTAEQKKVLNAAVHPLVRIIPRSNRCSLYLAAHASHVVDWPVPEGRMLLLELTEHATQSQFVYRHEWQVGDFVIWDNRATMHRARHYDDLKYRRELVRVTTLDTAN
jgi:alpha-ketoglutarate-dependent 2,4-dichlorophenoxyacetate dioxygenase